MADLEALIGDEIAELGPMSWSRFVELALYHPTLGFYERGGRAGGRAGDFVTSVEVGPLFGAVVGDWLDRRWDAAGQPSVFTVAEAAAGVGTLWRGVRRSEPRCFRSLRWVLVERSSAQRAQHAELPPGGWESRPDLPPEHVDVVLANELLDNLVFDVAEMTETGWKARVIDRTVAGQLEERIDHRSPVDLRVDAPLGARIPVPTGARAWLTKARSISDCVTVFDYAATTAELIERGPKEWLRGYAEHGRVADVLSAPGTYDITHDVPIDLLLPPPSRVISQADWLCEHGIEERVATARQLWEERRHIGDLEAMFARSAVHAGDVLTDPNGLGGFVVLEWD